VMLNDDERVAAFDEAGHHRDELRDVCEVEARRRLVEDVERGGVARRGGELGGELEALGFAARWVAPPRRCSRPSASARRRSPPKPVLEAFGLCAQAGGTGVLPCREVGAEAAGVPVSCEVYPLVRVVVGSFGDGAIVVAARAPSPGFTRGAPSAPRRAMARGAAGSVVSQ